MAWSPWCWIQRGVRRLPPRRLATRPAFVARVHDSRYFPPQQRGNVHSEMLRHERTLLALSTKQNRWALSHGRTSHHRDYPALAVGEQVVDHNGEFRFAGVAQKKPPRGAAGRKSIIHRLNAPPGARFRSQTGRGAAPAIACRDLGIGNRIACLQSRRLSSSIQALASAIVLKPSCCAANRQRPRPLNHPHALAEAPGVAVRELVRRVEAQGRGTWV